MDRIDKNIMRFCALVAEIGDKSHNLRRQKDEFYDGGHSFEKVHNYEINELVELQEEFKHLFKLINGGCLCIKCTSENNSPLAQKPFRYACEICGNKRCPHHSDHSRDCTNSNDTGQEGSIWK